MELLKKIWCFLKGHDMVKEGSFDNGRSKFGGYRCMRCGKESTWQYDYDITG